MEDDSSFDCSQLEKKAYEVFAQTLQTLNQLSYDQKHSRNPFWILRQICQIDFMMTEEEEGQRNLIEDAWYDINREYAEYLLKDLAPGTFLFRKDEYASYLKKNSMIIFLNRFFVILDL